MMSPNKFAFLIFIIGYIVLGYFIFTNFGPMVKAGFLQ